MESFDSIGGRLRAERDRLGLSQEQLCEAMSKAGVRGATRQTQSRYEKGERSPDAEYLAHLAALGADVEWVLTGGEPPAPGAPALTAEEQVLLEYFRAAGRDVRRAALNVVMGAAGPGAIHQQGSGNVGHVSGGVSQIVSGDGNVVAGGSTHGVPPPRKPPPR